MYIYVCIDKYIDIPDLLRDFQLMVVVETGEKEFKASSMVMFMFSIQEQDMLQIQNFNTYYKKEKREKREKRGFVLFFGGAVWFLP